MCYCYSKNERMNPEITEAVTNAILKGILVNLNTSQFPKQKFIQRCIWKLCSRMLFLTDAKFLPSEFAFCKI